MGRWVPLTGLKASGTYKRALRNEDSTGEEHMHSLAYSQEQGRGCRLKTPGALATFLWLAQKIPQSELSACFNISCSLTALYKGEGYHCQGECTHLGNSQLGPHSASEQGEVSHYQYTHRGSRQKNCLELWPNIRNNPSAGPGLCQVLVPALPQPPTLVLLSIGVKVSLPRRMHSDLALPLNKVRMAIAMVHAKAAD